MSNDISRVYQFLSKQTDWQKKADSYGKEDGIVTSGEFKSFMLEEFDGWDGITSQDGKLDLINEFWKKFDTNTSTEYITGSDRIRNRNALDDNEIKNMEKYLEMWDVLEDYTKNLTCPSIISAQADWVKDVKSELGVIVDEYAEAGKSTADLRKALVSNASGIALKVTAEYCASEYLDSIQNTLKEYEYKFGDDETLQTILSNFAGNLGTNTDINAIQQKVKAIVNAYLQTAGLGEASDVNLADYGYTVDNTASLNDVQKSVAQKTLEANLEAIKQDANYAAYAEKFDAAVAAYIENIISTANYSDFNTILKYGVNEFKNTEAYKNIKLIADATNIVDCKEGTALYEQVKNKYGENIAKVLTEGVYLKSYKAIMDEALEKVQNGELTSDELVQFMMDKFEEKIIDILDEYGYTENLSNEELAKIYNTAITEANEVRSSDPEKSLQMHKEAAIQYCQAIAARGEAHAALVSDVFGGNYTSVINSCTVPSKITELVEKLQNRLATENVVEKVAFEDKTDEIMDGFFVSNGHGSNTNALDNQSRFTFYVSESGEIKFVVFNVTGGVFNDTVNNGYLQNLFYNVNNGGAVRSRIEGAYAEFINGLGLTDTEKDNLYNIALFMAVSDPGVVSDMYSATTTVSAVVEALAENYSKILQKIASDENARDYLGDVQKLSLLYGRTTSMAEDPGQYNNSDCCRTFAEYYKNDSTAGGDDWIELGNAEASFDYAGASGTILHLNKNADDGNTTNASMERMLMDYINKYDDYISGNRIIQLFKQAQETAIRNMGTILYANSATGAQVYGYGETPDGCSTHNTDSYKVGEGGQKLYSVNTLLINITYEMEKLISKELLGV